MKYLLTFLGSIAVILLISWKLSGSIVSLGKTSHAPVVVELFTSEGCSSCPPADAILEELDRSGTAIVLSEHVDYWNQLGWQDPYSSHIFSDRQNAYGARFGLSSVYTPQMVVDGNQEFVGSDSRQAHQAVENAGSREKTSVRINSIRVEGDGISAHIESDGLKAGGKSAEIFLLVALDHVESQVGSGENTGRKLTHAGVVRSLTRVGAVSDKPFAQDVRVPLRTGDALAHLRLIAFVQGAGPGRILGANQRPVLE